MSDLLAGLWYIQLNDASGDVEIRSQIVNEVGGVGTHSVIPSVVKSETMTGGVVCGGSATTIVKYRPSITSAGVLISGTAPRSFEVAVGGRAIIGGQATVSRTLIPSITSAGVLVSSSAINTEYYTVTVGTAGPIVGGSGVIAIAPPVSGGALCAGTSIPLKTLVTVVSGGAVVSGSHVKQQTYASQPIKGGVKCRGNSTPTKIRYKTISLHRNYALLMASENKLNQVVETGTELMDPARVDQPALSESRYRARHFTGWCDLGDGCDFGYLPPIVKKRQGKYLPPKGGSRSPVGGQIAKADIST
jgi:hypothetical protein